MMGEPHNGKFHIAPTNRVSRMNDYGRWNKPTIKTIIKHSLLNPLANTHASSPSVIPKIMVQGYNFDLASL
jgi:hypothetical protein